MFQNSLDIKHSLVSVCAKNEVMIDYLFQREKLDVSSRVTWLEFRFFSKEIKNLNDSLTRS